MPGKVRAWFDKHAEHFVSGELDQLREDRAVAKALKAGAAPSLGTIAKEYRVLAPSMDLHTGALGEGPTTLPDVLEGNGAYCAMVSVGDVPTASDLCASQESDGSVEFYTQEFNLSLLDLDAGYPSRGYAVTDAGLFSFDVTAGTFTALDDEALQNVPQRTIRDTELVPALSRATAERQLVYQVEGSAGAAGGGGFPLFGASDAQRAKHDAMIRDLLARADGTAAPGDAGASAGADASPAGDSGQVAEAAEVPARSDRSTTTVLVWVGVAVLVLLLAGGVLVTVRRRRL